MARTGKPARVRRQSPTKLSIPDELKPEEGLAVLGRLLATHPDLRPEAERIARAHAGEVSFEAVADDVEAAIEALAEEDVGRRARPHRWGYVGPDEAALELLEKVVDPFLDDMKRKIQRGLEAEALEVCQGIPLGLYRVSKSHTDLLEFAPEFPEEHAAWVMDIWRAGRDEDKAARRTRPPAGKGPTLPKDFVDRFVPEWTWLIGEKTSRR